MEREDPDKVPNDLIRIKAYQNDKAIITYINPAIQLDGLTKEVRELFSLDTAVFTMKFIDDEGDPCFLSNQDEFDEAIRLFRDIEITLHVFSGTPQGVGLPCIGEDKNIYRRGARRWRKLYKINGHVFQPKRFNRRAFCVYCSDRIWGLGRQGFKCIYCKVMVHKKCHKLIQITCLQQDDNLMKPNQKCRNDQVRKLKVPFHDPMDYSYDKKVDDNGVGDAGRQYCLDDFDLIRVIGRGSYAKVLLVELKKTKRPYAMKVIKKEIVTEDEDIDWVQTEKHVFEIATGCDFLVGLHSCFQTESKLFFVIEFVSGGDLMFHMQRQRRLPEANARFYAAEISLALNYLHERGIIYRDLKLDNVLLDRHGHIKLTDYGMCKEGIRPGDKTCTFCGTPNYIAPEILRGLDYSFPVDWWALGVLTFEMLAGHSPFNIAFTKDNPDTQTEDYLFQVILEKTIRIPRSINVKAQSVLRGFLMKDPAERLGSDLEHGFEDIKNHPFFRAIDFDALAAKRIDPPYQPKIEDDLLEHFDPAFINEPVVLTPPDMSVIERIDQSEFEGFEFINPEIMTVEDAV